MLVGLVPGLLRGERAVSGARDAQLSGRAQLSSPLNLLTWISQFSTLDLSHSQGGFRNIEISIFKRSVCGTSGDQPSGSACVDFDSDLSMLPAAFPLRWQEDQRELRSKMIYWAAVWRKWKLGFFKIVKTGEQWRWMRNHVKCQRLRWTLEDSWPRRVMYGA